MLGRPSLALFGVVTLCGALWSAPVAAETPRKLALLVAIDHYGAPHTSDASTNGHQWKPLGGTVNDATMLGRELQKRGFEVKLLTNRDATLAGIEAAFRQHLIANARPGRGDVALFHFSGHGQQVADTNGVPDEADGYDEALVPYDNRGTRDASRHLRDDQLGEWLAELAERTTNVVVTLDSCHSGTGTRGELAVRGGEPPVGEPAVGEPAATAARTRGGGEEAQDDLIPSRARGRGYVLMTATMPRQLAKEYRVGDVPVGVFTWSLVRALQRADARSTYRQLIDQTAVEVARYVTDQTPQIEGDADKRVFSGQWADESYFTVKPIDAKGRFPIDAGQLHGLARGAVVGIYPHSGALDPKRPPVRARIEEVKPGEAWARPEGRADLKALKLGGRAIELEAAQGMSRLRVALPAAARALKPLLGKEPSLQLSDEEGGWDVKLTVEDGAVGLVRVDGSRVGFPIPTPEGSPPLPMADLLVPAKGALKPAAPVAPHALDASGARAPVSGAAPLEGLGQELTLALRREARRRQLTRLVNDDRRSRAAVELTITPVDAVQDGDRARVTKRYEALSPGGVSGVKAGTLVQFMVENASRTPLYVSLIALSPDGEIAVLYPHSAGGENKLKPGSRMALPDAYGFSVWQITGPVGQNVMKVVATEEPIDLRGLNVAARRGEPAGTRGGGSALSQMLAETVAGTRAAGSAFKREALWGTSTVIFGVTP